MSISRYLVTVKHDAGTVNLHINATDEARATEMIMSIENCPRRAIKSVRRVGAIA
jgi:ferredoxin